MEAKESIAKSKGVICVHKGDSPPASMPKFVGELGLKVVPWKHKELSEAIEEASQKRT